MEPGSQCRSIVMFCRCVASPLQKFKWIEYQLSILLLMLQDVEILQCIHLLRTNTKSNSEHYCVRSCVFWSCRTWNTQPRLKPDGHTAAADWEAIHRGNLEPTNGSSWCFTEISSGIGTMIQHAECQQPEEDITVTDLQMMFLTITLVSNRP